MKAENFLNDIDRHLNSKDYNKLLNLLYDNLSTISDMVTVYANSSPKTKITVNKPYSEAAYTLITSYKKTKDTLTDDQILFFSCSVVRLAILKLLDKFSSMKLEEKDEIKEPKHNIQYTVLVADDENKTKLFMLYLVIYNLESIVRARSKEPSARQSYVGIDYEFNNRNIALMQINFETEPSDKFRTVSYIWLVNPGEFDEERNNIMIRHLMVNNNIVKILHGSDSLDVPYMYNIMFRGNKNIIKQFTKKLVDTRFLCEYYRVTIGEEKKCSIYDALLYFGVITENRFNFLNQTHDSMGPVQDISWNIHKMSIHNVRYALYDVLFLRHLLFTIHNKAKTNTPNFYSSYKFIQRLTRFVYLERRDITALVKGEFKPVTDSLNNYMITDRRGRNTTLINIFNTVIETMVLDSVGMELQYVLAINYFKSYILAVFKYIVYSQVLQNFVVYVSKNNQTDHKLDTESVHRKLHKEGYTKLIPMFKDFQNQSYRKLMTMYK